MDADDTLIAVDGLSLAYGARRVLDGVSLRIHAGERWCVIGANGAGKSTLLGALLGLLPAAAGRIRLHPRLAGRSRIGYVPQTVEVPAAVPTTVSEFAGLGLVGLGLSRPAARARLVGVLSRMGLREAAGQALASCSSGQRQRAAIARALVRDPPLLVLDEPTASLDHQAARSLLGSLAAIPALTVLLVTHDRAVIRGFATHLAVVADGGVHSGPARTMQDRITG